MLRSSCLHSPAGPRSGRCAVRVLSENVMTFVNAAVTSTGQREFHSDAAGQRMSLAFLHEYVLVNYRPLYAAALALDVNDHNAAMIVVNLLRTGGDTDAAGRAVEGRLVGRRLRGMPPQRVYKVFGRLRRLNVNNRRTRAIVRDWIAARPDVAFDAVKYRAGLSAATRYTRVPLPAEVGVALFGWRQAARFATPVLESWRRAHYDKRALYELP